MSLEQIDQAFFILINQNLSNSVFDILMPLVRNKINWIPLYIAMLIFMVWRERKWAWIPILALVACVICTDQISSFVIKPFFERLRPCNLIGFKEQVNLLVNCGSGFSFTSSHATNHFGIAVCFGSFFFSYKKWILFAMILWAAGICYAQVYVGVHFPFDVIAGGILGAIIGLFLSFTAHFFKTRLSKKVSHGTD